MKDLSHSIERRSAFGGHNFDASHGWCQTFDFGNSFTRKNSIFEEGDSTIVAVDAMEGNAFLDFHLWVCVDLALGNSLQRNADFVVIVDQFVFQNNAFAAAQMIKFSFVFFRLFVSPFVVLKFVVLALEWSVFGIEFGFEWGVFSFVEGPFWFVVTPLTCVFLAGLIVEFSVRSPPLTFVGAGVIVFEFSVFWIFGIFILTIEFIEVFGVSEVTSTELRLTIQFGIGFTAQTALVFAGNLR